MSGRFFIYKFLFLYSLASVLACKKKIYIYKGVQGREKVMLQEVQYGGIGSGSGFGRSFDV